MDHAKRSGSTTYEHFADRDLLSRVVLERMLAGVSTRRYARTAGARRRRASRPRRARPRSRRCRARSSSEPGSRSTS